MKKIAKIWWTIYIMAFCWPYSLKQFKYFCLKIEGMAKDEWDVIEADIRNDYTLSKFFKLVK